MLMDDTPAVELIACDGKTGARLITAAKPSSWSDANEKTHNSHIGNERRLAARVTRRPGRRVHSSGGEGEHLSCRQTAAGHATAHHRRRDGSLIDLLVSGVPYWQRTR
ncbi:hypothetical protein EVAR_102585_1 [Eumeta japonica]|uniref:Uncharacterized protein n=1 Tax=Eumeta variegata TaxID=151549 RepID=A0A4C1TUP3_EUMVA|nr:hypothetical protein EVAR_102585_1 [Eumeta japonica]